MNKKVIMKVASLFCLLGLQASMDNQNDCGDIFQDKIVCITGGTGFLGQAIIEKILPYNPKQIIIFSRDEVKHYKLLEKYHTHKNIHSIIGDVRDYLRVKEALKNVDILIHAAALKRIDLMESNAEESVRTNLEGTINIIRASIEQKVKKVVLVSTDKACMPINVYGACKFIGERLFCKQTRVHSDDFPIFICVRYGNVIESTGSVIPLFVKQILNNENISLTSPKMTRFLIPKNLAIDLICAALRFGIGGEIFIPKLPAVKVTDLIEVLQNKLKGNSPINIIGARAGEKFDEILINPTEIEKTYKFGEFYVIATGNTTNNMPQPEYIKNGVKLTEQEMSTYSSADNPISKEKLANFLELYCTEISVKKSTNVKFNVEDNKFRTSNKSVSVKGFLNSNQIKKGF